LQTHPCARRLLVVDDERVQRTIIVRSVEHLGFAIDSAATLAEAAQHIAIHRYDAVVLDLSLGENDGLALLEVLRDSGADPVLIFISRLDDRIRAASIRLAAANGLRVAGALPKPLVPLALVGLLRTVPVRSAPQDRSSPMRVTEAELAAALRNGDIRAEFQPQVLLSNRSVVGVEALARWQTPAGLVPPEVFVTIAEHDGLIVELTTAILRQSLAACRRWRAQHPTCSVAVNLSPMVLADHALPQEIEQLLRENELGPGALVVEITESRMIAEPLVAAGVLTRLRIKGISLSIDDFGTGHSSLMTLHRLPFSELKIDRSFVTACDTDEAAWKIVRATISLARELGLTVVAEGIETEPVARMLRDAGCQVGQGWLFGHAMPEAALHAWLADNVPVTA
jgi:EAL domain-containing protein (putative c-di-GMP-specific phosphodiesterase class I)/AmiR/NasT family two-component response regulator